LLAHRSPRCSCLLLWTAWRALEMTVRFWTNL
jgi:hypothetical protein